MTRAKRMKPVQNLFDDTERRLAVGLATIQRKVADAETKKILGAAILGTGGDEAIHGVLDIINANVTYDVLQRAVPIHPTVSELIPTLLSEMRPDQK